MIGVMLIAISLQPAVARDSEKAFEENPYPDVLPFPIQPDGNTNNVSKGIFPNYQSRKVRNGRRENYLPLSVKCKI